MTISADIEGGVGAASDVSPTPFEESVAAFCQGSPLRGEIEMRAPGRIGEIVDEVAEHVESRHEVRPRGGMSAFVVVGRVS